MVFSIFPDRRKLCGPVTTRHLLRFFGVYLLILLAGFALTQYGMNDAWQVFGLGLMLPGAGFLAHADCSTLQGIAHFAIAAAGALLFIATVILWFATGNAVAPPFTWLLLAISAAQMKHGHLHGDIAWIVLATVFTLGFSTCAIALYMKRAYAAKRARANEYLKTQAATAAARFAPSAPAPEFTPDDLRRMRFLLDRALQPLDTFNGFEWLDQFQTAAVRYQINFTAYALSMAQVTHLPAFGGYLHEAQDNLIRKQADHRIWGYWNIENLWGNLRHNPDPVARENIMYTGFCALQMAMHQKATGSRVFEAAGSFTLQHPSGKNYAYSLPQLVDALKRETAKSPFHLIACEPNWIYPLCNTIGAAAVKACSPHVWRAQEESFRASLENEFIDLGGRFIPCRSRYTGLALPCIGGVMPQALACFFLNATLPDIALRHWLVLRDNMLENEKLRRERFWRIDTGNYRFTRASAYAATALAAAELGDGEVKNLCLQAMEEECPTRTDSRFYYRPKASVWAHGVEFFARSNVTNGFRDIINAPEKPAHPRLEGISYHEVQIAKAVFSGETLHCVLYPRTQAGRFKLKISGLAPATPYICKGAEEQSITSDRNGDLNIHAAIAGRTEIMVRRD